MNLILEILIQSIIAFIIYAISHWAFLQYNDDFPKITITQGIILGFLILFFFLFVNGGRDLFELLKDGEDYITMNTDETNITKEMELDKKST